MKSYFIIIFLTLAFPAEAVSQAAIASVTSRATIVEPIKIQKSVDLDFGNVIASYSSGSLVLSPDGTRTAFGVSISNAAPGKVNAAEAIVTHGDYSYSITLPDSFTLYNEENPNQMLLINNFTVEPHTNVVAEGSDIIKIGATLNLEANQVPGFYTNPIGFNVTVSYD